MVTDIRIHNLPELGTPLGQYSHISRVRANEFLFIAGLVGIDQAGQVPGDGDFAAQAAQIFINIETALKAEGAGFGNVIQFTTYLVHPDLIDKFMAFRLKAFPKIFPNGIYPPNTLLIVDRLVKPSFLIEVQTIAAI